MTAGAYSFTIEMAADFNRTIHWLEGEDADPVDVSGYDARLQVRTTAASTAILFDLSSDYPSEGDGPITVGGTAGTFQWHADAAVTEVLDWDGRAYYDFVVVSPLAVINRLLEGRVSLSPQITEP